MEGEALSWKKEKKGCTFYETISASRLRFPSKMVFGKVESPRNTEIRSNYTRSVCNSAIGCLEILPRDVCCPVEPSKHSAAVKDENKKEGMRFRFVLSALDADTIERMRLSRENPRISFKLEFV